MLTLKILGKPIAKKRHRFFKRGKFTGTYNSQRTEEGRFLWEVTSQLPEGFEIFSGPLVINIFAEFARPKSHFGSGKNAKKLKDSSPQHHTQTPDTDNIAKFVLDCLNGIIFEDDKQVVSLFISKGWGHMGSTVIIVDFRP